VKAPPFRLVQHHQPAGAQRDEKDRLVQRLRLGFELRPGRHAQGLAFQHPEAQGQQAETGPVAAALVAFHQAAAREAREQPMGAGLRHPQLPAEGRHAERIRPPMQGEQDVDGLVDGAERVHPGHLSHLGSEIIVPFNGTMY
jgi:hypothetical protein